MRFDGLPRAALAERGHVPVRIRAGPNRRRLGRRRDRCDRSRRSRRHFRDPARDVETAPTAARRAGNLRRESGARVFDDEMAAAAWSARGRDAGRTPGAACRKTLPRRTSTSSSRSRRFTSTGSRPGCRRMSSVRCCARVRTSQILEPLAHDVAQIDAASLGVPAFASRVGDHVRHGVLEVVDRVVIRSFRRGRPSARRPAATRSAACADCVIGPPRVLARRSADRRSATARRRARDSPRRLRETLERETARRDRRRRGGRQSRSTSCIGVVIERAIRSATKPATPIRTAPSAARTTTRPIPRARARGSRPRRARRQSDPPRPAPAGTRRYRPTTIV